jgi:small subunit ribosomal protein S16
MYFAINATRARDSVWPADKHCALQIGTYDPIPYGPDATKEVRLRVDRIKYWLAVGAQPSDRVAYLFWRAGLMPAPPLRFSPTQMIPKKTRREAAKAAKGYHTLTDALISTTLLPSSSTSASSIVARSSGAIAASRPSLASFSGMFTRVSPLHMR